MKPERRHMGARLQRGVIIVPSTLTLGNLFFGFWAIISAARGEFRTAAWHPSAVRFRRSAVSSPLLPFLL
jgi:hypothetical protein